MTAKEYFKQEHPSTPAEAFIAKSQTIFDTRKLNDMAIATRDISPAFKGFLSYDHEDALGFKLVSGGTWEVPEDGSPVLEGSQFV